MSDLFQEKGIDEILFRYTVNNSSRIYYLRLSVYSDEVVLTELINDLANDYSVIDQSAFEDTIAYGELSCRAAVLYNKEFGRSWTPNVDSSAIFIYLPHDIEVMAKARKQQNATTSIANCNGTSKNDKYKESHDKLSDLFQEKGIDEIMFRYTVSNSSRIYYLTLSVYSDEDVLTELINELANGYSVIDQSAFEDTIAYGELSCRAAALYNQENGRSWMPDVDSSDISIYLPHDIKVMAKAHRQQNDPTYISIRNEISKDGKYKVSKKWYDQYEAMYCADIATERFTVKIKAKTLEKLEEGIDQTYERLNNGYNFLANTKVKVVYDDDLDFDDDDLDFDDDFLDDDDDDL